MRSLRDILNKRGDIFRNSLYNLSGNFIPLVIAVFVVPIIIRGYGNERFGILSLAWIMIGYFSLADLGLSRALTKFVAERVGQNRRDDISGLIWTSLALMTILGIVGTAFVVILAPILSTSLLKIQSISVQEVKNSFYILSIGIPFTLAAAGLRGILEALMRFDLTNYVRTALGVFNFVGPALVLLFSESILAAIVILVISRIASLFIYLKLVIRVLPEMNERITFQWDRIKPIIKFGGWITVSNLISPAMTSFDRFFLGSMVSVSALAFYSAPWEIVARLLIIPSSLAAVLFPVFSRQTGRESVFSPGVYYRSVKYILAIMLPICILLGAFSKLVLNTWLGQEYALNSFRVMQVMLVAILINGISMIPFSLIQGIGKPDITAKFHIIEFFIYVPLLWLFIKEWGVLGAAVAWLARVALDLLLLFGYVQRILLPRLAGAELGQAQSPLDS